MFTKGLAAFRIAIENLREALRSLPWQRRVLRIIDILALLELFLPFPLLSPVFLWLASVVANHLFTPKIFTKILEGILSFSGALQTYLIHPLPLNPEVLAKHQQLSEFSCIPMSVEFVLKLLGRVPPDYFELQKTWENGSLDFREFDGRIINGARFTSHYTPPDRNDHFPLNDLFSAIEQELASRRYVIVSLPAGSNWHNWVIYNRLPNGEFEAITKGREPEKISNVREQVHNMKGTDILTYELEAPE